MTPEQRAEMHRGPSALLLLRNPATFSFGMIDGVIYSLLMAGAFGWLWPR